MTLPPASYRAGGEDYARVLEPTLAPAVEVLVQAAGARPGMRVLDLATGTGLVARAAASRGADVVGLDPSLEMLAQARERSPAIDFREGAAEAIPFPPRSFDAIVCGLGLSHFDLDRALAEVRRVLRDGGAFAASAWASGSQIPSDNAVTELLDRYAEGAPRAEIDEETWLDVGTGRQALLRGGFEAVRVRSEHFTGRFADPENALRWSLAWPLRKPRIAWLGDGAREAFVGEARAAVERSDLSWRFAFHFYLAETAHP